MKRPLIGITCRLEPKPEYNTAWHYLQREYSAAVWDADGLPVLIPLIADIAGDDYTRELVGRLDGIVLSGSSSDVDPARYGQPRQPDCGPTHPERDAVDLSLIRLALETHKPLLGICFGTQALNVALGGTLIQHLAHLNNGPLAHDDRQVRHDVAVEPDSLLERLGGGRRFVVNTSHHQALDRVPPGLRVTARSSADGVIEAVETTDPGRFLVGVQWHPERIYKEEQLSRALFEELVRQAKS
jgi:putative glutamine amidotransferase